MSWRAAFDHHVALGGEAEEQVTPLVAGKVERDALLVGVEVKEQRAALDAGGVRGEWAAAPALVAGAGRLDLDDLRAVLGKQLGAIWPGYALGGVQHSQSV